MAARAFLGGGGCGNSRPPAGNFVRCDMRALSSKERSALFFVIAKARYKSRHIFKASVRYQRR